MARRYMLRTGWLLIWLFACSCLDGAEPQTKFIRLRNELISTAPPPKTSLQAVPQDAALTGLFLVQFNDRLLPAWRDQLQELGVALVRYVPDDAFVVRLEGVRPSQIKALSFVRWVGEYRPDHKVHSSLRLPRPGKPANEPLAVSVLLSLKATPQELYLIRRALLTRQRESRSGFGTILHGEIKPEHLGRLAQSHAVLWIEPAAKMKLVDEVSSKIVGGGEAPLVLGSLFDFFDFDEEGDFPDPGDGGDGSLPPDFVHETETQVLGFDGKGVVVDVADSGLMDGVADTMHPDLAGRVDAFFSYGPLEDAADEHSHGTHVTGIVAGNAATGEADSAGALYGLGVAPGAHIVAQRIFDGAGKDFLPPYETLTHDAVRAGAIIGSNSWGEESQGRYDLSAAQFDALVRDADAEEPGEQPYILEFSAGNSGPGAGTILTPAVAKNVIATGASQNNRAEFLIYADGQEAMADFSSRGPCEDGRIKPDIIAPGTWIASLQSSSATDENAWLPISVNYQYQGGTSQAGPHASGAAAVFVQYYRETHTNATPSPALVKAALINSAMDMDNTYDTDPVPNMDEGWGRVSLPNIIGSIRRYDYVDQTDLLSTGQTYERRVAVGSSDQRLKITLVYTDVPGLPAALPALVNDLDLEVVAPDGKVYQGNQFFEGESIDGVSAGDNVNNVEAVHLSAPKLGEYIVRVRARNVVEDVHHRNEAAPQQDFALVVSGDLPVPGVGILFFDRAAYSVPGVMQLKLIDFDLKGQLSVSVRLQSTTESGGEEIVLKPFGELGVFTNSVEVVTSALAADGRLQVLHGDLISAKYQDASPAGERRATARADLLPPVISAVVASNRFGKEAITFETDEPASVIIRYGTNVDLTLGGTNRFLATEHEVELADLKTGVEYFFLVIATDEAGNTATNNNGGQFFQFVAQPAATVLLVNAYVPDDPFSNPNEIDLGSYTNALNQTGVSYEVWDVPETGRSPTFADLKPFRVVIWRLSDSFYNSATTISPAEQSAITNYLNQGGAFLLTSMEIMSRAGMANFRTNVLHVRSFVTNPDPLGSECPTCDEDHGVPSIEGIDSEPITSGMSLTLDYSAYPLIELEPILPNVGPDLSDTFTAATNAAPILIEPSSGRTVGVRFPRTGVDSPGRVVFLAFPLDAVPEEGTPPNTRAHLLRNILSFLAPGVNGLATVALDREAYSIPDQATIELADSDLAGNGQAEVKFYSTTATNGLPVVLAETVRPGVFRGSVVLVAATNQPAPGRLPVRHGDEVWVEYFDTSTPGLLRATAEVDTVPATITSVVASAEYEEAVITWETSKPADSLVQFSESEFPFPQNRTEYSADFTETHELTLSGLKPDQLYFFQVVSRDEAGNTTVDNNGGNYYTFRTLKPLKAPWADNLDSNSHTNWTVVEGEFSAANWQLGVPNNGQQTSAHSPPNAWGSNLDGAAIDLAQSFLLSPAIDLTGGNVATLRFWQSFDFSDRSTFDIEGGLVYVVTNSTGQLINVAQYTDSSEGWEPAEIDLTPYLGRVVYLVFEYQLLSFDFENTYERTGWLIDDVSVTVTNIIPGTIEISNNLAQAGYSLTGPMNRSGQGTMARFTNAPPGEYVITYRDVPFYQTPPAQTKNLAQGGLLLFQGDYLITDANTNTIADAWETQFFGEVNNARTTTTDTDGDSMSDYAEFIAGTSPTNAASLLELLPPVRQYNGPTQIRWASIPGRSYRVEGSVNALDWPALTDWVRASRTNMTYNLLTATNGSPYLFRVQVRP